MFNTYMYQALVKVYF